MARTYGQEFPERPLMGVLSDLLGIRHFTTAKGSTVRRDFLEAMATALGLPMETLGAMSTKDEVLVLAVEAATGRPMDPQWFSGGETVTNEVLQAIIDGVTVNGVPGRPTLPNVEGRDLADGVLPDMAFAPEDVEDARTRRLMEIAAREGQDRFRTALLEAYGGRCAITGYDAVQTLEAAHIYPYRGPATNRVTNGMLLRSDLHRLFDRGAISVHETSLKVLVKPHLLVTRYAWLAGSETGFRQPHLRKHRPATAALRSHREWAGM